MKLDAAPLSQTEELAAYWASAGLEDVPPAARRKAKMHLLDVLACAVAGAESEVVDTVVRAQKACFGEAGGVRLWGRTEHLAPPAAALVNGTAAHALEIDDFGGCGHSSAVVVPAALSLAEQSGASGADMLIAILAGYDIAARVLDGAGGYRDHNKLGWHSTGTCGSFGAAAAAARILHLPSDRFASALGIAGSFTGGLWAFLVDGAMTKRFHAGKAAETGVQAATLAAAGMTGPRFVLEAEWGGFYSTSAPQIARPETALIGLGEEFLVHRSGIKLHACCRTLHACLDGVLAIREQFEHSSEAIERVLVHGNEQTVRQFNRPLVRTLLDAQFSAQYCIAVAAESGGARLDQFVPLRIGEAEVRRLMSITEVVADRDLGATGYPSAEIIFKDGARAHQVIEHARGAPQNPVREDEIRSKARALLSEAVGCGNTASILQIIEDLEEVDNVSSLTALLTPPKCLASL